MLIKLDALSIIYGTKHHNLDFNIFPINVNDKKNVTVVRAFYAAVFVYLCKKIHGCDNSKAINRCAKNTNLITGSQFFTILRY